MTCARQQEDSYDEEASDGRVDRVRDPNGVAQAARPAAPVGRRLARSNLLDVTGPSPPHGCEGLVGVARDAQPQRLVTSCAAPSLGPQDGMLVAGGGAAGADDLAGVGDAAGAAIVSDQRAQVGHDAVAPKEGVILAVRCRAAANRL